MSLKSQITRTILSGLPESIIDRLSEDEKFVTSTDTSSIRYSELGSFDHEEVLAALRSTHEGKCNVTVVNHDGVEFELERLDEGVRVTPLESEHAGRFIPEFKFLDPVTDVRLKAIKEAAAACHPFLISEEHWQSILAERVLSEIELAQLVSDIRQSPSEFIAGLTQKWHSGNINSHDLFPRSLSYYEALVGPCPTGQDVESYINDVLVPHQKQLLNHSLEIGLKYVLPTNIDQRMSPSMLVAEQAADALLEALTKYAHSKNPFIIVGILEIVLPRIGEHDRFREMAEELANRLVEGDLLGKESSDYYQLMSSLVQTCLGWISVEEGFWGTPPYWRRLVAYTHAHFLFEVLVSKHVDVKEFTEWLDTIRTSGMFTADLLDMQKEPLWSSNILTPIKLKSEVISRLVSLGESLMAGENKITNWPSSEVIIDELKNSDGLLFLFSPGPMEGRQRFSQVKGIESSFSESMDVASKKLLSGIEKEPTSYLWINFSVISRMIRFDQLLLDGIVQVVGCISIKDVGDDRARFFEVLVSSAYLAAMQSCESGADAVVSSLLREADKFQGANEAESGYNIILVASAAFEDKEKWMAWLEKKMADYAFSLPKGSACRQLLLKLETLEVFFPVSERCFGRARKFASSALS